MTFSNIINTFKYGYIIFITNYVLIYINDLPDCVEKPSYNCLFADDAKMCHILQSSDDIRIQLTLANIDKWMSTWQLELATSKCKVMRIGKCINKSNYNLNDNLLKYYN